VDPVPDPLLIRKSGSAGDRARTSGLHVFIVNIFSYGASPVALSCIQLVMCLNVKEVKPIQFV
jgi:hypothetical protein